MGNDFALEGAWWTELYMYFAAIYWNSQVHNQPIKHEGYSLGNNGIEANICGCIGQCFYLASAIAKDCCLGTVVLILVNGANQ